MAGMIIELVIRLDAQTNAITVTGPIHDRLLCYGMLTEAKDIITAAAAKPDSQPQLVRATELPRDPRDPRVPHTQIVPK